MFGAYELDNAHSVWLRHDCGRLIFNTARSKEAEASSLCQTHGAPTRMRFRIRHPSLHVEAKKGAISMYCALLRIRKLFRLSCFPCNTLNCPSCWYYLYQVHKMLIFYCKVRRCVRNHPLEIHGPSFNFCHRLQACACNSQNPFHSDFGKGSS